ncbi:hypothetical protein LCGC14_0686570 [marine sediment metagenome]|uniref:Uncharacterized protein n=1 Tax=marine sediment metagenome TaxID=412755 RepID=A0A0F9QLL3_9ZZZZ
MPKSKFNVGDKVRLNKRAPGYYGHLLQRTRTIISIFYDDEKQGNTYELGARGRGGSLGFFRSYMLSGVSPAQASKIGRPKTKRSYKRR